MERKRRWLVTPCCALQQAHPPLVARCWIRGRGSQQGELPRCTAHGRTDTYNFMRDFCIILLSAAAAAAFAPHRSFPLRLAASRATIEEATDAAVALCAKEGAPAAAEEDRRLDVAGAADAETVRTNFVELIETVGDADAALRIVTNNKMVAGWKPDRVKASFDAWVERCETREEALDLVSKNPGLLFCKPADVKDSPAGSVLQAKMIAGAMDFFRFGK